jgi:AcrR family transcriptional regulator
MNNPSKSVHPKSTTERLLDSAERLFADKGVAATSLREITTEASANLASVSYHFGSKEGLLREVLGRRIKPVNAVRVGLLDALDARPVRASVEEIIDAFMRPIFEQPKTVRQNFSRLMARLHSSPEPVAMEYLREIVGPTAERTLNSLARSLPGVSLERIFLRVHFISSTASST